MKEILIFAAAFAISLATGFILLPVLRKFNLSVRTVRQDGPSSHFAKQGTPLMGGAIFLSVTLIGSAALSISYSDFRMLYAAAFIFLFAAVGFLDDYVKAVNKGRNGIGMKQKMIMLTAVSALFAFISYFTGFIDGKLVIPVLGFGYYFDIGAFIIPFAVFILLAATNSVNFTDGVDGLAGSTASIVLLTYVVITSLKADWGYLNMLVILLFAGLAAFLYFNYHPAKIFMGDSGSLALGGAIGMIALFTKTGLVLPVIGIIYVIETISVIMQIVYYKKTSKRLFKMAPIHHHFELSGYKENTIVAIFSIITVIACAGGIYLLGIRPF